MASRGPRRKGKGRISGREHRRLRGPEDREKLTLCRNYRWFGPG